MAFKRPIDRPAPAKRAAASKFKTSVLTARECVKSDPGDHAYGEIGMTRVEIPLKKPVFDADGKETGTTPIPSKVFFVPADVAKASF